MTHLRQYRVFLQEGVPVALPLERGESRDPNANETLITAYSPEAAVEEFQRGIDHALNMFAGGALGKIMEERWEELISASRTEE